MVNSVPVAFRWGMHLFYDWVTTSDFAKLDAAVR